MFCTRLTSGFTTHPDNFSRVLVWLARRTRRGFLQIGTGALASAAVGLFGSGSSLPAIGILTATALLALLILTAGKRTIVRAMELENLNVATVPAQ